MRLRLFTFFSLFFIMFISFQPKAFANHSATIGISPQTYTLILYIFMLVGILLVAGIFMIWRLTRKINDLEKMQESAEKTRQTRLFFILATIMAAIGFVSAGFFYFIISSMVNHH